MTSRKWPAPEGSRFSHLAVGPDGLTLAFGLKGENRIRVGRLDRIKDAFELEFHKLPEGAECRGLAVTGNGMVNIVHMSPQGPGFGAVNPGSRARGFQLFKDLVPELADMDPRGMARASDDCLWIADYRRRIVRLAMRDRRLPGRIFKLAPGDHPTGILPSDGERLLFTVAGRPRIGAVVATLTPGVPWDRPAEEASAGDGKTQSVPGGSGEDASQFHSAHSGPDALRALIADGLWQPGVRGPEDMGRIRSWSVRGRGLTICERKGGVGHYNDGKAWWRTDLFTVVTEPAPDGKGLQVVTAFPERPWGI